MDIFREQRRDEAERQPVASNDEKKGHIARKMSASSKPFLPMVLPEKSPLLFAFAYGLSTLLLLLLLFVLCVCVCSRVCMYAPTCMCAHAMAGLWSSEDN